MIGVPELLLILLIILILFGARKLPQLGEGLGKGIKGFQKSLQEGPDEEDQDAEDPRAPIEPQ